jgi:hypothetical protein
MTKNLLGTVLLVLLPLVLRAQDRISVTGTPIPKQLLVENYGPMPKNVAGYDLSICNVSGQKQTVLSSEIYQALANSNIAITPIGRQIMLAAILRNQSRSLSTILNVALNSATGVLAILSTSSSVNVPKGLIAGIGLGSMSLSQFLNSMKPVLGPDKVEKFDRDVLPTALALDSGSCVEQTVFAIAEKTKAKPSALRFHMN